MASPVWPRLVAWLSGNMFDLINKVILRRAGLVLGWVIVCEQVNHFCMVFNQPPRSTQPSNPPG